MIYLARQEGATKEGAREKLRRRSSVRRKSTGDLGVQVISSIYHVQIIMFLPVVLTLLVGASSVGVVQRGSLLQQMYCFFRIPPPGSTLRF